MSTVPRLRTRIEELTQRDLEPDYPGPMIEIGAEPSMVIDDRVEILQRRIDKLEAALQKISTWRDENDPWPDEGAAELEKIAKKALEDSNG